MSKDTEEGLLFLAERMCLENQNDVTSALVYRELKRVASFIPVVREQLADLATLRQAVDLLVKYSPQTNAVELLQSLVLTAVKVKYD